MAESRNNDILTVKSQTSERINIESKKPPEEISDKKEDNKEIKYDIKDIEDKKSDYYQDEVIPLLKIKKAKLQNKFKSLYDKFDDLGDKPIYDIIEEYSKDQNGNSSTEDLIEIDQGNIDKIKEKKRIYLQKRKCKIYTFAFFFLTFYLVGIFQLLDLFDATKKITGIIFKLFFSNKSNENKETFKDLYVNSCFKNIPEFDFAFVTSFIGSLPLNLVGFFWSSLLFTILNSFLFVNFMKLELEKEKYDFFDFFHVSIYFILFFISFGAISLFAHEKISEGISYYEKQIKHYTGKKDNNNDKEKKKENNINNEEQKVEDIQEVKVIEIVKKEPEKEVEEENQEPEPEPEYEMNYKLFFIISLGIIFAYIINKAANYSFYQYAPKLYKKKNFRIVFLIIYVGSYVLSLIFYFFFHYQIMVVKEIENYEDDDEKIKSGFFRFCGFLMFYEKVPIDNRNDAEKNDEKKNKAEEKAKNESNLDEKINIKCSDICCSILIPGYRNCKKENKFKRFICASCKLGCRKFYNYSVKYNLGIIACCTCCECKIYCCEVCRSCCCVCCENLDELKESYEEEEIFAYVYETQRKCSWFCDIVFENNIISLIIHNISIELGIIGFEKKLNENLESRIVNDNINTIGAYLGCFLVFIFIIFFTFIIGYSVKGSFTIKGKTFTFYFIFLIIFYACDISLSGLSLFGKDKIERITDDWLILLPLAYTKYINFLVLGKLVSILDSKTIDILSNSLIMTSVFFVYDIIVFLITDLLDCSSDILIYFQLGVGFIIVVTSIIGEIISAIRIKVMKK